MDRTIVGDDMVCPATGMHCDDECCTPGANCNIGNFCWFTGSPPAETNRFDWRSIVRGAYQILIGKRRRVIRNTETGGMEVVNEFPRDKDGRIVLFHKHSWIEGEGFTWYDQGDKLIATEFTCSVCKKSIYKHKKI